MNPTIAPDLGTCQRDKIDGRACDNTADGTFNGHPICFFCEEDLDDKGILNDDNPEHQDLEAKFQLEVVYQACLWWQNETGRSVHTGADGTRYGYDASGQSKIEGMQFDPEFLAFISKHADPNGWFVQMCEERVTDDAFKWYKTDFTALTKSGIWPREVAA
jgi:hypothetical protein